MRFFNLVTIERRGGTCFQLKDTTGRTLIGTMTLNSAKARHEMELSEPDYLRHAKALALLCRIPGCAVYVESVRDDESIFSGGFSDTRLRYDKSTRTRHHENGKIGSPIPEIFANTPFKKLVKIADTERVDISQCSTNAERAAAINEARKLTAA